MPYSTKPMREAVAFAPKNRAYETGDAAISRVVAIVHAEMDVQREREALWAELVQYAKAGELRPTKEQHA